MLDATVVILSVFCVNPNLSLVSCDHAGGRHMTRIPGRLQECNSTFFNMNVTESS